MFIQDEQGLHRTPRIAIAYCDGIFDSHIVAI
jgi:hypothetical protein